MKTSHSPAARRLMALALHPSPVQHFADGGAVSFGARGLAGLRDLIPKMQAMGYQQAAPAPAAPAPAADPRAAQLQAMIPQMEAMGYKQQRMANGGHVRGPGTGTSDSIPAKLSDGEFVLPADTVRKVGVRRLQDLVDMTHTPVNGEGKPGHFAGGGMASTDDYARQMEAQRQARRSDALAEARASANQSQASSDELASKRTGLTSTTAPLPGVGGNAGVGSGGGGGGVAATAAPQESLDSRVASIPTGGLQAPAADGSQDRWSNTETGRNLSNLASAIPGSLGGAVPAIAKTGGAISGGIDAATRLLNAGAGAAAISAIPSSAAAQSSFSSAAGAGRGMVNPPAVDPSASKPTAPASTASTVAPSTSNPPTTNNVTRVGNSYSGMNVAGDITVNGRTPGGGFMNMGDPSDQRSPVGMTVDAAQRSGQIGEAVGYNPAYDERSNSPRSAPSAQNSAAADNLASRQQQDARGRLMALATAAPTAPTVQAPLVRHSGNDWQSRNDLRNAEVGASSIMQTDHWGKGRDRKASQAYDALFAADIAARAAQPAMEAAAMRENASLQREGMQQGGETERANIRAQGIADANQIARGRLSLEQIAAGYSNRSADRIDRAQAALENATTPEGQKSARARLMALAGKADDDLWAYSPGGQTVDPRTGMAITQPGVIFNKRTGETRSDGGQQATQRVTSQAQFDALPKGATYTGADGRTYRKP